MKTRLAGRSCRAVVGRERTGQRWVGFGRDRAESRVAGRADSRVYGPLVSATIDFDGITAASLADAGHLKWTLYGPGRLGAFVAEMDYGCAPAIKAAIHGAVDRELLGYPPPAAVAAMRTACASWQAEVHGWDVAPDDVHPIPGVVEGLEIAVQHCSRPGSPVIVPVPAYTPFLGGPVHLGREVIQIEMVRDAGRYVFDLDALDRAYRDGGDLLIMCNPHNPLGRVMERAEMEQIATVVARHGGRVFSDEVHAPLVFAGHRHVPYASTSPTAAEHTVTATSASKGWNLTGMKCAQLILSNDADRERMAALGPFATHGASTLGVVANTVAFDEGRAWLNEVLDYLDGNRHLLDDLLAERLPGVRHTKPEGTYLAWLDCRGLGLPRAPSEFFAEQASVVMVDGSQCGEVGAGFVRLNFATTRALLTQMVTQLADAVARYNA